MNLKNDCKKLINNMKSNIYTLKKSSNMSSNISEKMFYDNLIMNEYYKMNSLKFFMNNMVQMEKINGNIQNFRQNTFTLQELKDYNGKNGNNAYIAIDGKVYDVTYNAAWAAGTHFGLNAGNDLSLELDSCHNNKEEILRKLKVVGVISNG